MCPDRRPLHFFHQHCFRQRGFSLPLALFIIVVLGALSVVMYRVLAIGQSSVAQEVLATRALLAADSGAQAMMMQLFPASGTGNGAAFNWTHTGSGLSGCSSEVSSSSTLSGSITLVTITSVGQCAAGALQARRTVTVQARGLQP